MPGDGHEAAAAQLGRTHTAPAPEWASSRRGADGSLARSTCTRPADEVASTAYRPPGRPLLGPPPGGQEPQQDGEDGEDDGDDQEYAHQELRLVKRGRARRQA